MSIRLSDDGTLDTVLVCTDCGQEFRGTYDGEDCPTPSDHTVKHESELTMLVKHCSRAAIEAAAHAAGVRIVNLHVREGGWRFRLGLAREVGLPTIIAGRRTKAATWQRTSAGWARRERRVAAVCWHGYRAYLRELFRLAPEARVWTALNRRAGLPSYTAQTFEHLHRETAYVNVGSQMYPVQAGEACDCGE